MLFRTVLPQYHILKLCGVDSIDQWSLSMKVMQLMLCRWRQVILNAILCTKMVLFHWWYGHMNICKLSPMIILQRYSQNLPYSTFLMCWVHWYEFTSMFASIGGRASMLNNLLQTSYCTLFFVWVFPWGFSCKVFDEAISTQDYVISSIFSLGFLMNDIGI